MPLVEWHSPKEAAALFGITVKTVRNNCPRWHRLGLAKRVRVPRRKWEWRIRPDAYEKGYLLPGEVETIEQSEPGCYRLVLPGGIELTIQIHAPGAAVGAAIGKGSSD